MSEINGKKPITVRLTANGQKLLYMLCQKRGINRTAMLEVIIRDAAEAQSVYVEDYDNEAAKATE